MITARTGSRSQLARLWLTVLVGGASACALTPPVQNGGPAISREGTRLAVVRQRCEQSPEADRPGDDLAELIVEVSVHNPTSEAATVRRTDFRLLGAEDAFAIKTSTWGAVDPLMVGPNSDRSFEMRFMARGAFECAKTVRLDPRRAVMTGDQPVKLDAVAFVPRA
jgi:hypothetical protein